MPLSAERKLYLLEAFPTLVLEEHFAHADAIETELVAVLGDSEASPARTVMDYTVALREKSLEAPIDYPAFSRSGDLFKYVVRSLEAMEEMPQDISVDDLLDFISEFEDQALVSAPHALYVVHMHEVLDDLSASGALEPDFLKEVAKHHPAIDWSEDYAVEHLKKTFAKHINLYMAKCFDMSAATTAGFSPDSAESMGQASISNLRVDDGIATADHKIDINLDHSMKEIVKTILHETDHTYQMAAQLMLHTYELQLQKIAEQQEGIPLDKVIEIIKKVVLEPDRKSSALTKMIYCHEEFRFFATFMNLASRIYPKDIDANPRAYLLNPKEIQAFDIDDRVDEYLAATPERRAEVRQQAQERLENIEAVTHMREILKASLQAEITVQSIATTPMAAPTP